MKTLLVLFTAFLYVGSQVTATEAPAASTDTDIGDAFFGPQASAAGAAQPPSQTPKAESALELAARRTTPAPAVGGRPVAKPVMPTLPQGVQIDAATVDTLTLQFNAIAIDEALRPVARSLDRPLHIALSRSYAVTGEWRDAAPATVLRDIAAANGLILRETASAYVLEEGQRTAEMPSAAIVPSKQTPSVSALVKAYDSEAAITHVDPLRGKDRDKALARAEEQRRKSLAQRELLLRGIQKE